MEIIEKCVKNGDGLLGGEKIQVVKEFKYLGVVFTSNGRFQKQVQEIKVKAMAACYSITKIIRDKRINNWSRIMVCWHTLVASIINYSSMAIFTEDLTILDTVKLTFVKRIFNLPMSAPSKTLYKITALSSLSVDIRLHALNYFSKLRSQKSNTLLNKTMEYIAKKNISFCYTINKIGVEVGFPGLFKNDFKAIADAKITMISKFIDQINTYKHKVLYDDAFETVWLPATYLCSNFSLKVKSLLFQLFIGALPLRGTVFAFKQDKLCRSCGMKSEETCEHFLYVCPNYEEIRNSYDNNVFQVNNWLNLYKKIEKMLANRKE